jgi:hypothetical protein
MADTKEVNPPTDETEKDVNTFVVIGYDNEFKAE